VPSRDALSTTLPLGRKATAVTGRLCSARVTVHTPRTGSTPGGGRRPGRKQGSDQVVTGASAVSLPVSVPGASYPTGTEQVRKWRGGEDLCGVMRGPEQGQGGAYSVRETDLDFAVGGPRGEAQAVGREGEAVDVVEVALELQNERLRPPLPHHQLPQARTPQSHPVSPR